MRRGREEAGRGRENITEEEQEEEGECGERRMDLGGRRRAGG